MKEKKRLEHKKSTLIVIGLLFAIFFLLTLCFLLFDKTEGQDILFIKIFLFAVVGCVFPGALLLKTYRKKVVAYEDYIEFYFMFQKKKNFKYSEISKAVVVDTKWRGMGYLYFYKINNIKIVRMEFDLSLIIDFANYLKTKNIVIEEKQNKRGRAIVLLSVIQTLKIVGETAHVLPRTAVGSRPYDMLLSLQLEDKQSFFFNKSGFISVENVS